MQLVARLETRKLLRRTQGRADRRLKNVRLTLQGRQLLARMNAAALRAHQRTVIALPAGERRAFLCSLRRLVDAGNEYGRAPMHLG